MDYLNINLYKDNKLYEYDQILFNQLINNIGQNEESPSSTGVRVIEPASEGDSTKVNVQHYGDIER